MTTINTIPATLSELSGTYVLDPAHTRIGFVARHAMVTKVRGAFNEFEGSAVIDGTDFTKSTGQLTIQAASIDTRNEQRDGHLRSNDFLAMEVNRVIWAFGVGVDEACRRISRGDAVPLLSGPWIVSKPGDGPPKITRAEGQYSTKGGKWKGINDKTLARRYKKWLAEEKERQQNKT